MQFCKTLLGTERIELNKKYDIQKNGQNAAVAEVDYYVCNDIDGIDKKMSTVFDLQNNESFYIGGVRGIPLYHYLIKRDIKVKAIIDNRAGDEFPNDILVIYPDDIEPYSKIFIAVANEISNFEIKEQIKKKKCRILTYKELLYNME